MLASVPAAAHHSRSAFALDETITVHGTVTEVGWTNPHYYLSLVDERARDWTFEGHSIPGLVRNGWSRNTFSVGQQITVVANPNKKPGVLFGLLQQAAHPGGETYYSFKPSRPTPAATVLPSTDFTGTWRLMRSLRDNLITATGTADWPLNERGRSQLAQFTSVDDPSLNCEPRGLPRMLEWPYAQQWRRVGDAIHIRIEHAIEQRWLRPAVEAGDDDVLGLGRSRIVRQSERELVVESRGFAARAWGLGRGIDSSTAKVVTERYQLAEAGMRLQLDYTIADPAYLTDEVTQTLNFAKVPDYTFAEEPPCDVVTAQRHLEY